MHCDASSSRTCACRTYTNFDLSAPEVRAVHGLLQAARARLRATDATIAGFNVGVNEGATAGQTVAHCHVHLIPRRPGDVPSPRGGVRHVIPGRGDYGSGGAGEVQSKSAQDGFRRVSCPGCRGVGHLGCKLCGGVGMVAASPQR